MFTTNYDTRTTNRHFQVAVLPFQHALSHRLRISVGVLIAAKQSFFVFAYILRVHFQNGTDSLFRIFLTYKIVDFFLNKILAQI